MKAMNGHIIPGTPICVDYWQWTPQKKYIHFLSHLHADHTVNLKSTFCEHIYTSPFNAWLVKRWFNVAEELVISLNVGESHVILDETTQTHFSVTLFCANHCPGAVMFLFQGEFGNILYTGDFRYTPDMLEHPMLKSVIDNEVVHRLYLDNTFAAEHCEFPSRQEALKDIIKLIIDHPEHHILIGIRKLGKEEVLREIALKLREKVWVSKERKNILAYLQYEDVFTTNADESRIYVKEMPQISSVYIHKLQQEKGPVLTILLTALYSVMPPGAKSPQKINGVHYIPYSDHSCHSELVKFVSKVKPHSVYPVVGSNTWDEPNKKNSLDDLSDCLVLSCSWCNSVIPHSILKYSKNTTGIKESMAVLNQEVGSSLLTDDESWVSSQQSDRTELKNPPPQDHLNSFSHKKEVSSESKVYSKIPNELSESNITVDCLPDLTIITGDEEYSPLTDDDLTQISVANTAVQQPKENEQSEVSEHYLTSTTDVDVLEALNSLKNISQQTIFQNSESSEIKPIVSSNRIINNSPIAFSTPNMFKKILDLKTNDLTPIPTITNFEKEVQESEPDDTSTCSRENIISPATCLTNNDLSDDSDYIVSEVIVPCKDLINNNLTDEFDNAVSQEVNVSCEDSEESHPPPVKIPKRSWITERYSHLLGTDPRGNSCQCDSDSDCFCKALTNNDPQPSPDSSSNDSNIKNKSESNFQVSNPVEREENQNTIRSTIIYSTSESIFTQLKTNNYAPFKATIDRWREHAEEVALTRSAEFASQ